MVVIEFSNELAEKHGDKAAIRCYKNQKKIFEMLLAEKPKFIDMVDRTIAFILPKSPKSFYLLNVNPE